MGSSINYFQILIQIAWLVIPVIVTIAGFIANSKGQTSAGSLLIVGGLIRTSTALFFAINSVMHFSFVNSPFFNILNLVGLIGGLMMAIGTMLLARSFVIPVKNYSQRSY